MSELFGFDRLDVGALNEGLLLLLNLLLHFDFSHVEFVSLKALPIDYKVVVHDTAHLESQYCDVPDDVVRAPLEIDGHLVLEGGGSFWTKRFLTVRKFNDTWLLGPLLLVLLVLLNFIALTEYRGRPEVSIDTDYVGLS